MTNMVTVLIWLKLLLQLDRRGSILCVKKEDAIALLDRWRRRDEIRESSHPLPSPLDKASDLEEMIQLLHPHKRLSFLVDDYSINAPKPPSVPISQWDKYLPLELSGIERCKLL